MQDIRQETLNECTRAEQSASVVLWEIDLTEVGGDRYFFCNEQNEKGESVTWQSRQYQAYPIQGSGFEMNGKGSAARPTLTVSNLHGMVTGMAEDLQSLVGGTVVRRKVYARFLDAVNFVNGNSDADPEQEVISRWRIEQCSETECGQCLLCVVHTDGNGRRCFSGTYHAGQHLHLDLSRR
ncbi:phage minor tail protein [Escherichia coli]|uniref:Phage minor tail protein n=1 Tax=Escherichia coli TaxID=562 RepID=A0A377KCU4_ECOLX|nr:phage minor tail protein [Escherichia coli]